MFNGECDAMVDMTLNDLKAKVKVIHFDTNDSSYNISILTFVLGRTV